MAGYIDDINSQAQDVSAQQGVAYTPPTKAGTSYQDQFETMSKPVGDYMNAATDTVAGQMNTLLSSDNPYIKLNEDKAIEQASGRGLLNTTIASGAGRDAAIRSALPIASQDATAYGTLQQKRQQGDIQGQLDAAGMASQGTLQGEQADQRMNQTSFEAGIQTARDKTLAGYTQDLAKLGFANQKELQDAAIAGNQDAIRLQGDIQTARDQFAADTQRELTQMGLDAKSADLYTSILGNLTNTTLGAVNSILNNVDITDVDGAIDVLEGFLTDTNLGATAMDQNLDLTGSGTTGGTTSPISSDLMSNVRGMFSGLFN